MAEENEQTKQKIWTIVSVVIQAGCIIIDT